MNEDKDENVIVLSDKAFDHMLRVCEKPPPDNLAKMRKLLSTPTVFDNDDGQSSAH